MCPSQENQSLGCPTRSNTNQTVLQQNIAKFWIHVVERNHLIRENKGDKQLWDCRAADQHLCFHVIKSMFSHDAAHID